MENINEAAIETCSLCGSRVGPFRDVITGRSKLVGIACKECQGMDEDGWKQRMAKLLPKPGVGEVQPLSIK